MKSEIDQDLIVQLVRKANKPFDGHLTMMKFTTGWRVGFGTPSSREDIDRYCAGTTFDEAARQALLEVE
jgi:hypothetical protein